MSSLAASIPSFEPISTPDNLITFPKRPNRTYSHTHTQQRVSPIRDPQIVSQIFHALRSTGTYGLRNSCIFALQLAIGRRTNDILSTRLQTVYNFSTNTVKSIITVDEHKTGKTARDLPINSQTRQILQEYIETLPIKTPDALLFPSRKHNPDGSQRPLMTTSLNDIYKDITSAIYSALDTPQTHISSYAARKTYGYNIYTECTKNHNGLLPGTDINALQYVQSVFNHKDSMTTLRYIGAYDSPATQLAEDISSQYDFT